MRCGRCKASGVDVAHVRVCYSGPVPGPAPDPATAAPLPVEVSSRRPVVAVHAVVEAGDDWAEPFSDDLEDDRKDPWAEDLRSAAAMGLDVTGMDADGRSAWMRAVEDEDGLEGLFFSMPSSYDLTEDE